MSEEWATTDPTLKDVPTHGYFRPKYTNDGWAIFHNDPIQGGQQIHPQDHFPFSPLPNDPFSIEGLALFALIANWSRDPKGRAELAKLAIKYLDTVGRVVEALSDVKSFDWLTGINNNYQNMAVLHRLGLVADGDYMRVEQHYQSIFDKDYIISLVGLGLGTVETFVEGSKTVSGGGQGVKGGESATGLAALANILATKK